MFKITLTGQFPAIEAIKEFRQELRSTIIEEGLDSIITDSLVKLKEELRDLVNSKMPVESKSINSTGENVPSFAQSETEIIKHFFDIDLTKLRGNKDYTSLVESNVVISKDYRVRIRTPMSPFETFDESFEKAKRYFNSAIYILNVNGRTKYFMNPGIDISNSVKVVCSRDTGDTSNSRRVFSNYQNSNKRTKQDDSPEGRYAEWALKQEAVERMFNDQSGFLDISNIVNYIKNGDFDSAETALAGAKTNNKLIDFANKLKDLKENKDLNPGMKLWANVIKSINNLGIKKDIKDIKISYYLAGDGEADFEEDFYERFYSEFNTAVSLWITSEEMHWFGDLFIKAKELLKKYVGALTYE